MDKTSLLAALTPIRDVAAGLDRVKLATTPDHLCYVRVRVAQVDALARLYAAVVAVPDDELTQELARRAPVQGYAGGVPWSIHLRAYDAYAARYGRSQSAARLAERGGFGAKELDVFLPGWRDECSAIRALQERVRVAEARLGEVEARSGLVERVAASLGTATTDDLVEVLVALNSLAAAASRALRRRTDRALPPTSAVVAPVPEETLRSAPQLVLTALGAGAAVPEAPV